MKRLFLFLGLLIFPSLSALNAAASQKPEADGPAASVQADGEAGTISVIAKADTLTPYQNQPVLYTVRVVVRTGISSTSVSNISIANAIVEAKSDPDISDGIEHGMPVRVAEFHYIITPLQPGKMIIPPVVLQGKFQVPNLATLADPSGNFSFSAGTRQSLNFFSTYGGEPFTISSNATVLNVKAPATAMDPWLPLTSLKISEKIDASRPIHVGEPLTRKITLSAIGAVGSQLPDIGAQQQLGSFRTYADKPAMGENIDRKTDVISGWRTDSYNLIARNAGHLVLPAIKIAWWDVVNNKPAITELPERVVKILPATATRFPPVQDDHSENQRQVRKFSQERWPKNVLVDLGFALLCGLVVIVIAALLFGTAQWWKPRLKFFRLGETALATTNGKLRLKNLVLRMSFSRALDRIHTAEELKAVLQDYAHQHWGAPKNASLEMIFSISHGSKAKREDDDAEAVVKGIEEALYASKTVDVAHLKRRSAGAIRALSRGTKKARKIREKLSRLNPS